MKRRDFIGAAAASIFAPVFGGWYRRGSGLLAPQPVSLVVDEQALDKLMRAMFTDPLMRNVVGPTPLLQDTPFERASTVGGTYHYFEFPKRPR